MFWLEEEIYTLVLPRDVTAKIRRAATLINELDQLLKYWGEECFIHELNYDEDKAHYQLELVLKSDPPISECAAVLGDILHNLRSALDLWMSHQAEATSQYARSLRLQYPICCSGKDFRNWKSVVKDRVDERVIAAIRERQPYVENLPHKHWLLGLSELDNADKHRVMMSVDFGYTDDLNFLVSPVPPRQDVPKISYKSYFVTATIGGLVV
ncbi:hypothetical protein AB0H20_27105 [Nocardia fluminea]|uniref:hypothetical protein n=1 Tax=Nocardia fluminea TaxID=134984 RepID=UPI0033E7B916